MLTLCVVGQFTEKKLKSHSSETKSLVNEFEWMRIKIPCWFFSNYYFIVDGFSTIGVQCIECLISLAAISSSSHYYWRLVVECWTTRAWRMIFLNFAELCNKLQMSSTSVRNIKKRYWRYQKCKRKQKLSEFHLEYWVGRSFTVELSEIRKVDYRRYFKISWRFSHLPWQVWNSRHSWSIPIKFPVDL